MSYIVTYRYDDNKDTINVLCMEEDVSMNKAYPLNKDELLKRIQFLESKVMDLHWERAIDFKMSIDRITGVIVNLRQDIEERGIV